MIGNPGLGSESPNTSTVGVSSRHCVRPLAGLLAITLSIGCDDVVVQPADVAGVGVEPAEVELVVGGTAQLSAQAVDRNDRPLSGVPIAWSTLNAEVATVTSGGLVTGQGAGQVQVRATVGEHVGGATVLVLRPVPAAPSGLTATALPSLRVDLAWVDQSGNETGFEVERRTDDDDYVRIATVEANVTTYPDADVAADRVYEYRVRACGEGGCSVYSNEATATTHPVPPTGAAASPVSNTAIDVTWTDASATETSFRIERRSGAGSYSEAGTAPANATSFSDTGLAPGATYTYRVQACNDGGCSAFSSEAAATTPELPVPAPPSGLSASATPSEAEVVLSWVDNSDNETGFRLERRAPGETGFSLLTTLDSDAVSHEDVAVEPDGTYVYRVAACAAGGCSAFTNESAATTFPLAPSSLQATTHSNSRIDLSWTDNSATETEFRIERRTGGGNFSQIVTVGVDNTSYSDSGLAAETSYSYRVRACNGGGCSAYTGVQTATTNTTPAPEAPTDLTATTVSATRIDLAWTDNSSDETSFRVERRMDDGNFQVRATLPANSTTFTDDQVAADHEYVYRVGACTGSNLCSDYSNEATAITPPVAPTGPGAAAVSTSSIEITWDDNVRTATSFELQRRPPGGAYALIATLPEASTGHLDDDGLSPETEYTYRVRACNAEGCSAHTGGVSATTHLPAPSGLDATAVSATGIDLSWTDNSSTEEEFRIERRQGTTGPFSQVATVGANIESYSDTGRTPGTLYQYRVRACTSACSAPTNTAQATTHATPAPPSGLDATAQSTTSIALTWTDNSTTEQEFRVERTSGSDGWTQIIALDANTTSHVDTGLSPETSYSYRVRACSGTECSGYSSEASAVTHMPAPTALAATAVSANEIDLTWTDNSTTETGFEIQQDDATVAMVPASSASYQITGLEPETEYSFRVRAVNDGTPSEWSNTAKATTEAVPPPEG